MMNRFGMVLGVAAVATLAGCKDPDYVGRNGRAPQDEVKTVPVVANAPAPAPVAQPKPVETVPVAKIEPAPAPAPVAKPAEPVTTTYVVRRGDSLSKISQRYNVTISSIRRLNPKLKGDNVWIGQKIKLPGAIDVGAAPAEPAKAAAPKAAKKGASKKTADYTGATVEYVVKNGDTLGGIAYGHGINIRSLKKLNGLTGDALRVGQKLKVPADGKAPAPKKEKAAPAAPAPVADAPAPAPTADAAAPAPTADAAAPAPTADAAAPAEPASDAAAAADQQAAAAAAPAPAPAPALKTYVVQEGDDMTGVSVAWGVTASQIRELNNLGENDQLKPGQTIRLPADAEHQ